MDCYQCVAEYAVAIDKMTPEEKAENRGELRSKIREADTMVPVWQQQVAIGQIIVACVALPVCLQHVAAKEKTPEEKAIAGGHILPGSRTT